MKQLLTKTAATAGLLSLLLAFSAHASVNKSIKIGAGEQSDGASSVNGSVTVGEGAIVNGRVKTVNGTVRVGDQAAIREASTVNGSLKIGNDVVSRDLSTVNGAIRVGEGVKIDGGVSAVNGSIDVDRRSTVAGSVGNVNGKIELQGSEVGGDLSTVNGDVSLGDAAVVKGDLIVEKPGGWGWKEKSRKPKIVIGPGSRVEGVIRLERKVELFISESAEVGGVEGKMSLSDAVRFSGDRP